MPQSGNADWTFDLRHMVSTSKHIWNFPIMLQFWFLAYLNPVHKHSFLNSLQLFWNHLHYSYSNIYILSLCNMHTIVKLLNQVAAGGPTRRVLGFASCLGHECVPISPCDLKNMWYTDLYKKPYRVSKNPMSQRYIGICQECLFFCKDKNRSS
jgi:hypothetical protein